ncbi:Hsp70 family protein [Profundibacterium mesophilum]|uniref:Chaperone protein n=1 Tax=Profundibacterium mesophilum KAUST100406-0324 TaxID=1037889 RepID=A0A921TCE7_9RHOB|nr:Hsp70 family protein [Profundibacterium mesophilum]KAF0677010.1 putative chaperone protein [Profundibacterium mesophilum KAUST100406-0324]
MTCETLAVDFGTSNSAAAWHDGTRTRRLPLEAAGDTLPTAVFFPAGGGAMLIGEAAGRALVTGAEGRYMRALKSVLGAPLFHEPRLLGGRRRDLAEVVTAFLREVKLRAEAVAGRRFDHAVSGRPVRFHSDPARDARAEEDLRACYLGAGFQTVRFVHEPEAAARAYTAEMDTIKDGAPKAADVLGLVVDIGGGTSDFTLFRASGGGADEIEIRTSHGIRLGGTDFDQSLSLAEVMPLLGLGGELRRGMGDGTLPVPRAVYADLSNWSRIPFLYTPETRRAVRDMRRHAVDAEALQRLETALTDELGHDLAFAVEAGKIAANAGDPAAAVELGVISPGLRAGLSGAALDAALLPAREALRGAMERTLLDAEVAPTALDAVILVGGSSLMSLTLEETRRLAPGAAVHRADAFTAVIDGLALCCAARPPAA